MHLYCLGPLHAASRAMSETAELEHIEQMLQHKSLRVLPPAGYPHRTRPERLRALGMPLPSGVTLSSNAVAFGLN
jgi:hypothetical protein